MLFDQFRPGVLDRLGLGHAALRQANPRLVICALTGYGQTGPLAARAGHDIDYLARAGILGGQGPASGPPAVPGFQLADVSGGLWCAIAILGALRERDRTGQGAVLDIAMTDGAVGFASTTLAASLAGIPVKRGDEVLTGGIAPYRTYGTKDGEWMALGALEPKFWMTFCGAVGLEATMDALVPGPHQAAIQEKVAAVIGSKTRAEWEEFAKAHDCCLEPVLRPDELARDAHLAARGLFFTMPTPRGPVPQMRLPITPRDAEPRPAPRSGEHTRAILLEAGLTDPEIDALIAAGAARAG